MKLPTLAALVGILALVLAGFGAWFRHRAALAQPVSAAVVPVSYNKPKIVKAHPPSASIKAKPMVDQPSADELAEVEEELANPDGKFFDPVHRIMVKLPAGWSVKQAPHWGTNESTIFLSDPDHPEAAPSIYHREYDQPNEMSASDADAWLRQEAAAKAAQRVADGATDYVNGDMESRTIADRPALTWTADFTQNGQPWSEYLTRVYSPNGTTLFFMMAPKSDMPAMIPQFEQTINATVVP